MHLLRPWIVIVLLSSLLAGCASTLGRRPDTVLDEPLQRAAAEVPEARLLDVWIELFHPGVLPEDKGQTLGLSMAIREAEARFMPVYLRSTMEKTGYWGAVRVVPRGVDGAEVLVRGEILTSNAESLTLRIVAEDATGRAWFTEKYESAAPPGAYRDGQPSTYEAFASLYYSIANDLARFSAGLSTAAVAEIRRVADMRFAADMAPDVFKDYLRKDADGRYELARLPAEDDLMYQRIRAIRERDAMLVDTLNGHFDNYYGQMQEPYFQWRRSRYDEAEELREIESQANMRKALGAAAILGAIILGSSGDRDTRDRSGTLRNVMVLGGAYALKSGFDMSSESEVHEDAIEELGDSFSAAAEPMVVEVQGQTHELTGSAEVQYRKWRGLLRQLYAAETGFVSATD